VTNSVGPNCWVVTKKMKLEKENMLKQRQKLMNKFMNLEKINSLIQVDTNSGQTHAVVTQSEAAGKGLDSIRSKIRDVLISCLEKY